VHGVDAQAQQLERARSLARSADAAIDALKAMLQIGHTTLQRTKALARLSQTHLGVGELTGSLGIVAANAIEFVVGLGNLQAKIARLRTGLVTRTGELVHARTCGANGLGSLLTAFGDTRALDLGIVGALLQTADLGQQGAALALKAGNLAGGIALGGTRFLNGNIGLNDLARHMFKHSGQIGRKPLQLADTALALQGT
jgi:multidrug efflux pump subunit AcrA (membrane-fusion protein)